MNWAPSIYPTKKSFITADVSLDPTNPITFSSLASSISLLVTNAANVPAKNPASFCLYVIEYTFSKLYSS